MTGRSMISRVVSALPVVTVLVSRMGDSALMVIDSFNAPTSSCDIDLDLVAHREGQVGANDFLETGGLHGYLVLASGQQRRFDNSRWRSWSAASRRWSRCWSPSRWRRPRWRLPGSVTVPEIIPLVSCACEEHTTRAKRAAKSRILTLTSPYLGRVTLIHQVCAGTYVLTSKSALIIHRTVGIPPVWKEFNTEGGLTLVARIGRKGSKPRKFRHSGVARDSSPWRQIHAPGAVPRTRAYRTSERYA